MHDPLVTRRRRLEQLEALACRLNDLQCVGVRFPASDRTALANIICNERKDIADVVQVRRENGFSDDGLTFLGRRSESATAVNAVDPVGERVTG